MRNIPTQEASHPTVWPASGEGGPATGSTLPDLSPVGDATGSLFSILTPDAGGQSDNQSGPKRKKKRVHRYGRQE